MGLLKMLGNLVGFGSGGASFLSSWVPTFEEEIVVTVYGDKKSKRKDLYALAVSIAFGKWRNRTLAGNLGIGLMPPPGSMVVQYDAVEKRVTFMLKGQYGAIGNVIGGASKTGTIFTNGPTDHVTGGEWDFNGAGLNAILNGVLGGGTTSGTGGLLGAVLPDVNLDVAALPDPPDLSKYTGKAILTDEEKYEGKPIYEPAPPNDLGTRGSWLEEIITQALSDPAADCGVPVQVPPAEFK